ncbi:MAG TPA: SusC/RagA family TonB-linked outer membrane protein, partial [Cyclobacteriaceae bacterium]|nr:SusC/RagA family TonB-linked outer membrane protein [Cyclobacteriaceae bacterium]
MKQFLPVFLFLLVTSSAWAQDRAVEGKVTALEDGQALPGVNVLVTGTSRGTATDVDGHYRLELEPGENTLQFSFIGYKTQSIAIAGRTTIDMVLELETKNLEEVVIIGYGTQNKSDLTGAVSSVRGADLTRIPALDPTMALQGKVAGVQVTSSSGAPGSQPVVRIRGVGTFNDSSPIYVVDGVIVQDIAFLNSSDIQSMEILKDASSTAIYGSRGANGVILITTKQGKKGAPTISLSGDYSIQNQQKRINLLNGQQFATVVNEINPGTYNNINAVPNTNWQNQIFRKPFWPLSNAIMNYQFSASGSSDKIQYYVGVGYFKQEGIIPKSSYERLTIRFNNTYQLSNSIRFGNNLTFAPYQQQNTNGNVVFTAYRA